MREPEFSSLSEFELGEPGLSLSSFLLTKFLIDTLPFFNAFFTLY
jgi:hypothetical protein